MQFCMNSASESREDPAHFNALPPKRRTAAAMTIALHMISSGAFERKEPRDSIQASFEMQLSPRCESSGASIASEITPNHFDTSSALILRNDSARDSARCFNDPAQCSAIRCAAERFSEVLNDSARGSLDAFAMAPFQPDATPPSSVDAYASTVHPIAHHQSPRRRDAAPPHRLLARNECQQRVPATRI